MAINDRNDRFNCLTELSFQILFIVYADDESSITGFLDPYSRTVAETAYLSVCYVCFYRAKIILRKELAINQFFLTQLFTKKRNDSVQQYFIRRAKK